MAKKTRSKQVKSGKKTKNMFPTDEESIELRRVGAAKQQAHVVRADICRDLFGTYHVESMQWQEPYRVEIRSLNQPVNSCSCKDYLMNRLGTCKHIERVLQYLSEHKLFRAKLAAYAQSGTPFYDIYFDVRSYPPVLSMMRPKKRDDAIERAVGVFFSSNGAVLGNPVDAVQAIEQAMSGLPGALRKKVRLSSHISGWIATLRQEFDLRMLRETYVTDTAKGLRSKQPLKHPLFPYQHDGMMHLAFKGRALLADEMGLGKTVQAIAAAEVLRQLGRVQRVLVVCPASLKAEWEEQYHYFTGGKAKPVFGSKPVRLHMYGERDPFIITNYEQVRSDVDPINKMYAPDLVILDEAQRIKNWPTKTAKTMKLLKSPYAFVLTGTPLENRIEELYSLVEFANPHVFGSLFRFQRDFMKIDAEGSIQAQNLDELHRRVSPVLLRRRKGDVEDNLPERSDKNYFVAMTREQRNRYAEYEYKMGMILSIMKKRPLKKEEMDRLQMILACMRMLCDTPYILDEKCTDCPKLEELENILDEILDDPNTKIIIFSEWIRMLDLVKELLELKKVHFALHTGSVPQNKRHEQLNAFKNDPSCRVFLSTEAGGTGLNLQVASVVINMDLPWNPAKLEQRIARAWRKNQQKMVRVINLIAEKSIESEMIGKLAYKQALADAVLDGLGMEDVESGQNGRKVFTERLSALLNIEPATVQPEKDEKLAVEEITPLKVSKEYFTARYPDSILAIQQDPSTDAMLVIAKNSEDAKHVRETLPEKSNVAVEVVDSTTAELLTRLEKQGFIQFSPKLQSLFSTPGYNARTEKPKKDFRNEARAVWNTTQRENKAAQALIGADLHEMAYPHVKKTVKQALRALNVLENGLLSPDFAPETAPSSFFGIHAGLAKHLQVWLNTTPNDDWKNCVENAMELLQTTENHCINE